MRGASYDEASRLRRRANSVPPRDFDQCIKILGCILLLVLSFVVGKLIYLQVVTASSLSAEAQQSRSNAIVLQAKRGTIYDRNGNVLAMSKECATFYCNPEEVDDPNGAGDVFEEVLGGESKNYVSRMRVQGTFSYISRQVDSDDADEIEQKLKEKGIKGIYRLKDSKRVYPYGAIGSQVLGIVGIDGDGLTGLEYYYNDILKGKNGTMYLETGQGGTPIAGGHSEVDEARDGTDIVISLDIDIQRVAEETIVKGTEQYKADSGSVMVTDPTTGEILAACSTPLFDVTDTSTIEEGATSLKLVSSSYEPGSIFKVLTAAIGLESGSVSPMDTFSVPGGVRVGDDIVRDDDGRTETMTMDLREILRRSSNTGIALVTQNEIGETNFANGVSAFQIGQATGIDFPGEVQGMVKQLNQYDGASIGAMSFGQSLAIPLVQMVKAVGSIANDGTLVTPHFLVSKGGDEVTWDPVGTSVSKETADTVTDMMRTVVQSGTATAAQVKGYDIAGKTGTGEQADENGYIEYKYVSSLIGFAPADNPKVLVYVGLNGTPYLASSSSAPLFSTIMSEALSDMGVEPSS